MTGEGSEYSSGKRDESREYDEDEDLRREVKELIDEAERERSDEGREKQEYAEEDEYEREVQDLIDEIQGENRKEQTEAEEQKEHYSAEEVEDLTREAIQELEHEEEVERESHEETEKEDGQSQEHEREGKAEHDEDDNLSEWEKDVLENYGNYGADPEEVRRLWREHFEEDVKDELGDSEGEQSTEGKKEGESDEESGLERTEDTESSYDDGSGQLYAIRTESSEQAESTAETETTEDVESTGTVQTESSEGGLSKETAEDARSTESEATEQSKTSSQEHVEDSKEPETPSATAEEAEPQQQTSQIATAEYADEAGTEDIEKKPESGHDSEVEDEPDAVERNESRSQETEEATELVSSEELTPEDENWQREFNEMFNQLPEEFQEAIREHVEEEAEEDFEELARRHGLEDLLEDEETMEEVEEFLCYRRVRRLNPEASAEELAEEIGIDAEQAERWEDRANYPDAVKRVLNLEGYRVLDSLARGFREQDYPLDPEEYVEYLRTHPRLEFEDPMAPFEEWDREARAWIEIMRMRREGRLRSKLRNGREKYDRRQIEFLSKEYGVSEERIVSWLQAKAVPYLIEKSRNYNKGKAKDNDELQIDDTNQRIYKMYYKDGLTINEIARRLSMHRSTISKKFKENGWKIERKIGQRRIRKYSVHFWFPQVNGVNIDSDERLLKYIRENNPALLSRKDFPSLLEQARLHIELIRRFSDIGYIHYGEISKLAKEFSAPQETLRYLLRKAGRPRIYYLFHQVSIDDRTQIAVEMVERLNGVSSAKEMDRRFKNLYFYKEISKSSNYIQQRKMSMRYIRFWKEYLKGGTLEDIGRKLGVSNSTMTEWLKFSRIPTHIRYASKIPREAPARGWKWLPLKLNTVTNNPELFIQVPEKITTPNDLMRVLEQIEPLDTTELKKSLKPFLPLARHLEFMYLLGLIASDGGFSHNIEHSANVQLYVGKKYPWGLNLGRAFRFAMGRVGFNTERWADDVRYKHGKKQECMVWGCETSPFFAWMEKALLGLDVTSAKSRQPISAEWILSLPPEWRIAFIQGLADGDGWASVKAFATAISTSTNFDFYQDLFATFNIHTSSSSGSRNVIVGRHSEIKKAQKLPLFRYAYGRQKKLDTLSSIIESLRRRKALGRELELILTLNNEGHSPGEITEILWYRYGLPRTPFSIYRILGRNEDSKQ